MGFSVCFILGNIAFDRDLETPPQISEMASSINIINGSTDRLLRSHAIFRPPHHTVVIHQKVPTFCFSYKKPNCVYAFHQMEETNGQDSTLPFNNAYNKKAPCHVAVKIWWYVMLLFFLLKQAQLHLSDGFEKYLVLKDSIYILISLVSSSKGNNFVFAWFVLLNALVRDSIELSWFLEVELSVWKMCWA